MNVKNYFGDDCVLIEHFQVPCRVGITEEERSRPQSISLSLRLYFPLRQAGLQDDLRQTVDYAEVIQKIKNLIGSQKFQLIEAVAELIAGNILEDARIHAVAIEATKKVFSDIGSVGVRIIRPKEK